MSSPPVDVQVVQLGKVAVLAINAGERARSRLGAVWDQIPGAERARIEAERAESCEEDYRGAMADLLRKIEDLKEARP